MTQLIRRIIYYVWNILLLHHVKSVTSLTQYNVILFHFKLYSTYTVISKIWVLNLHWLLYRVILCKYYMGNLQKKSLMKNNNEDSV